MGYYLDEENRWALEVSALKKTMTQTTADTPHVTPRALVVINPGNPTGQCLTIEHMREIVSFCESKGLMILADEVYQENVYAADRVFTSFRQVVLEMKSSVELISFHSTSKGFLGECGRRGGYMHLENIDDSAKAELYKLASVSLCANIEGQIMVALMSNPPLVGDASYATYDAERQGILQSLKRRAVKLVAAYNALEGVSCNATDGALYTFPKITLPPKAVATALSRDLAPDTFYCLEMLAATGVVVVPGNGFGQVAGTYHFRSTILPAEEHIEDVIAKTTTFHVSFMNQYK